MVRKNSLKKDKVWNENMRREMKTNFKSGKLIKSWLNEFLRHETFHLPFEAINDAIINWETKTLSCLLQNEDENLDVSLSVPQYSINGQQPQQSVNQTYHDMSDQVNIWRKLRKRICFVLLYGTKWKSVTYA